MISERRQPAAPADPGHEHPPRRWRSARTSSSTSPRSPSVRQRHADPPREPPRADRRPRTDGQDPPGRPGDQLLEFRLTGSAVTDGSFDPEPVAFPNVPATAGDAVFAPISLPDIGAVPRVTRTFQFERGDGGWQINGRFMDCTRLRFRPQADSASAGSSPTTRAAGSTRCTSTSRSSASSAATACR